MKVANADLFLTISNDEKSSIAYDVFIFISPFIWHGKGEDLNAFGKERIGTGTGCGAITSPMLTRPWALQELAGKTAGMFRPDFQEREGRKTRRDGAAAGRGSGKVCQ